MIEWYKDEKLAIYFDKEPNINIRYIFPWDDEQYKKEIIEKPLINLEKINVTIKDCKNNRVYDFIIPEKYCWDGATINRVFYRAIGTNTDNHFLIASLVHDYMCENKEVVEFDRKISTNIFDSLLKASEVNFFKRFLMKNSVAFYQTIFGGW